MRCAAIMPTVIANQLQGVATEWDQPQAHQAMLPIIITDGPRYPVLSGSFYQNAAAPRAPMPRWGYARLFAAPWAWTSSRTSEVGASIWRTARSSKGQYRQGRIGMHAGAGRRRSFQVQCWRRWRVPPAIESLALQALVREPIKPCCDLVIMANTVHGHLSQSDKGRDGHRRRHRRLQQLCPARKLAACRGNRAP